MEESIYVDGSKSIVNNIKDSLVSYCKGKNENESLRSFLLSVPFALCRNSIFNINPVPELELSFDLSELKRLQDSPHVYLTKQELGISFLCKLKLVNLPRAPQLRLSVDKKRLEVKLETSLFEEQGQENIFLKK